MDLPRIHDAPYLALDCETDGLRWWTDKIFGFALSLPDGPDYYFDIRRQPRALEWLKKELPRYKGTIVNQHIKFDVHMLRQAGVIVPRNSIDCTMTRAALIDEHRMTYDLDSLGLDYIGEGKDTSIYEKLAAMFGGKPTAHAQGPNFHKAPPEIIAPYGMRDTRTALRLWEWQCGELEKQELGTVAALERELMPVIIDMEHGGVRINLEKVEKAIADIDRQAKTLHYQLNNLAGFEINPNPSGSIHKLFNPQRREDGAWVARDGTILGTTGAGKASIDADGLRAMKDPAAELILRLRKMLKTRDTFLKGHMLGHHHNGVIHCNINQTKTEADVGTITGRFSINDPALQQIHKRDEDIASVVRGCFEADEAGHDWVCNDWAQMDFRVFAHYVKNPTILKMYRDKPDTDFHQLASDLTGIPRKPRFAGDANAKQINLGLIFGMGEGKLAQEMGLPYTMEDKIDRKTGKKIGEWIKPGSQANAVFEKYHDAIPGVKDFLKNASSIARSRGYVRTVLGRRVRFPRGLFTHKAGGLIFQGSAADALKVKIIEVDQYLKSTDSGARLMLNVHDEFDSSVPKDRADIRAEITRIVTDFHSESARIKFRVPILSDQGYGANWWEACKE